MIDFPQPLAQSLKRSPAAPDETLPPALQAALARLDGHLHQLTKSVLTLLHRNGQHPYRAARLPDSVAAAQYRALEEAIAGHDRSKASSSAASPEENASVSCHLGAWSLRDDGWTLVFPDGLTSMPLDREERAVLLSLARSPQLRMGRKALRTVLEALRGPKAAQDERLHLFVTALALRLRDKTDALGEQMPLALIRGGGYQFGHAMPVAPAQDWPRAARTPAPHAGACAH